MTSAKVAEKSSGMGSHISLASESVEFKILIVEIMSSRTHALGKPEREGVCPAAGEHQA